MSHEYSWFASAEPTQWRSFASKLAGTPQESGDSDWFAAFVALPAELKQGALYLSGEVHPRKRDPKLAHWVIRMEAVPTGEPPTTLRARSDAVGGLSGFLQSLDEGWPAARIQDLSCKIRFLFGKNLGRNPFDSSGRFRGRSLKSGASTANLIEVMFIWKFDLPEIKGEVFNLTSADGTSVVTVAFDTKIEINRNFLRVLEDRAWAAVKTFLRPPQRSGQRSKKKK